MQIVFLGTSSAEAMPREGCDCWQCLSKDKKDKRLRSSLLIERKILIDAGPDIIKQLTHNQIKKLEAVLITHDHQDHVGGIKDLLKIRPEMRVIRLKPGQHFKLLGIDFFAFKVKHSKLVETVGLAVNNLLYLPDVAELTWAEQYIREAKIAVLDGSVWGRDFGGHMAMNEIISQTKNYKSIKKIYFTHNGHTHKTHSDLNKLVKTLGDERFSLAYDGLELEV